MDVKFQQIDLIRGQINPDLAQSKRRNITQREERGRTYSGRLEVLQFTDGDLMPSNLQNKPRRNPNQEGGRGH